MKKTIAKTFRTRIIAAAMALVAIAGTTSVMIESSFNDTSITASAIAISKELWKEWKPVCFRMENDEIEVMLFDQRVDKETFREVMWGIYNTYGDDITLQLMYLILPTPDNEIWLRGNINYYTDCLFSKLGHAYRNDDGGRWMYSIA